MGPAAAAARLRTIPREIFDEALAEDRGLVVLTGHFGSWEVGARVLTTLGRPVNMVTAHEPNPTRARVHARRCARGTAST